MRAPGVALVALALVLGAPAASAGEEAKPGPFARGSWADAQLFASRAQLVVVGKVVEAGKVEGKGWSLTERGDNVNAPVDIQQELTVEVAETLRGKAEPGRLIVTVKTVSFPLQALYQMRFVGNQRTSRQAVPAVEFALGRDKTLLLFLAAPRREKGGTGKGPERLAADHLDKAAPMEEPDAQVLASVRGFCRASADWSDPPKLPPGEEARVRVLVADLGSDDFEVREKAEAELKAMGARIRPHLEAAAKDKDAERAFRARAVLKAIEPVPGSVELPLGAAPAEAGPGTMKDRPKPKPEPGPEPEPAPPPPRPAPSPADD